MRLSTESFEPWQTIGSLFLNNKKSISLGAIVLAAAVYYRHKNNVVPPSKVDNAQQSVPDMEVASTQTEESVPTSSNLHSTFVIINQNGRSTEEFNPTLSTPKQ